MAFEPFDQSVWVAHSNGEYDQSGGKESPDFNSGQHHTNNANWMLFDVYEDVVFESVEVHSEGGGPQTIEIANSNGSVIGSVTQELSAGLNVFQLNQELPAGNGYQIRSGNDVPLLWRDDSGADVNYPYDIGGLASITSTTITGENQYTYYYFYYNWKMSSIDPCLSERVEFTVTAEDVSSLGQRPTAAPKSLLKMIDMMGREISHPQNQMVLLIYSDGSTEKRFVSDQN